MKSLLLVLMTSFAMITKGIPIEVRRAANFDLKGLLIGLLSLAMDCSPTLRFVLRSREVDGSSLT